MAKVCPIHSVERTEVFYTYRWRALFRIMANKLTIIVNGKKGEIVAPESWNDLTYRDLLLYYGTVFQAPGDLFTATAFTNLKLISMAMHALRRDSAFMAEWEADCIREDAKDGQMNFYDELRQVVQATLAGLFDLKTDVDGNTTYEIRLNLTNNPIGEMTYLERGKSKWLYGPSNGLGNLTVYELGMAFSYFESYATTKEEEKLDKLLAVLYRPSRPETKMEREKAWGGDRRQPLRGYEAKMDERAGKMKMLQPMQKQVLAFWFASCRKAIIDRYPKVFKSGGDKANRYGWGGVLMTLAENGALGNLEQVSDNHFSNALTLISMKADEAEAQEQRMKEVSKRK